MAGATPMADMTMWEQELALQQEIEMHEARLYGPNYPRTGAAAEARIRDLVDLEDGQAENILRLASKHEFDHPILNLGKMVKKGDGSEEY